VLFRAPLDPGHLFFVAFVASSLAIAMVVRAVRGSELPLREFLFPARLYRTRAFRLDLLFALVNQALYGVLVTGAALGADRAAEAIAGAADRLGVAPPGLAFGPLAAAALLAALFVARDFGVFAAHALQHRVPLLWAFHKVHHTTTALTPLSALRAHPVDDVFGHALSASLAALVGGAFRFAYGEAVTPEALAGAGVVVFWFHLAGHHLRHSHVWLAYGPWLGRILVSPAAHQLHHSRAPRHWNRNLGQFLAVWDVLFGTLYLPGRTPEAIDYGVSEAEDARFTTLARLYFLPFADAARYARSAAARLARTMPRSSSSTASGMLSGGVT
jgi:sterol desaturase/sphingolipid hydroxylase (fatty acid hydroxylase superfamily)